MRRRGRIFVLFGKLTDKVVRGDGTLCPCQVDEVIWVQIEESIIVNQRQLISNRSRDVFVFQLILFQKKSHEPRIEFEEFKVVD